MQNESNTNPQDTPPVNDRWRNVYLFVIAFLVLQVVLYYVFMKTFE